MTEIHRVCNREDSCTKRVRYNMNIEKKFASNEFTHNKLIATCVPFDFCSQNDGGLFQLYQFYCLHIHAQNDNDNDNDEAIGVYIDTAFLTQRNTLKRDRNNETSVPIMVLD